MVLFAVARGYSQTGTLPSGWEATAFRESNFPVTMIFPPGYTMPTWVVRIYNNGKKLSDSTDVVVSGDTVKFTLTKKQLYPLTKESYAFLSKVVGVDTIPVIGPKITVKIGIGIPTGTTKTIALPNVGNVRISVVPDASSILQSVNAATSSASTAVAARDSANRILDSARIYTNQATRSGTASVLRSSPVGTKKFELAEGLRSGSFYPDPSDVTSPDDSSMVIIQAGGMRYKRETQGFILPEWFGANPKDKIDDQPAIQKALNYAAAVNGHHVQLSVGKYYLYNKLIFKRTPDKKTYKQIFKGKGKQITILQDTTGMLGKTMIDVSYQPGDLTGDYNSGFEIADMTINGLYADTVIFLDKVVDIKLSNLVVGGGIDINTHVGRTFAAIIEGCYFNASNYFEGQPKRLLSVQCIYSMVRNCSFDGGSYGIFTTGPSVTFTDNNIEGSKVASIWMESNGGGRSHITSNGLRPYSGYDPSGRMEAVMHGLYISGTSGGVSNNTIVGNNIYMPSPTDNGGVLLLSGVSGTFRSSTGPVGYRITGGTSGANAQVYGFNAADGRIVLTNIVGGPFSPGETITQATSGATATISSVPTMISYGMTLINSTGNTVSANQFGGNASYCLNNRSNYTAFNGNFLESSLGGVYNTSLLNMVGNTFVSVATAVNDASGVAQAATWSGNTYVGTISGIAPQADSRVTTTQRDSLTSTQRYVGLKLFDTTVNKITYWNGSAWKYATETP